MSEPTIEQLNMRLSNRLNLVLGAATGMMIEAGLDWEKEVAILCNLSTPDDQWEAATTKAREIIRHAIAALRRVRDIDEATDQAALQSSVEWLVSHLDYLAHYAPSETAPCISIVLAALDRLTERLAAAERDRDRLTHLLSDALAHTPDSYHKPIRAVLQKTVDEAAK